MERAEMERAEMERAEMERAEMEQAEMERAEMERAEMERAEMERALPHRMNASARQGSVRRVDPAAEPAARAGRAVVRGAAFAVLCLWFRETPRALARALEGVAPFEGAGPCTGA